MLLWKFFLLLLMLLVSFKKQLTSENKLFWIEVKEVETRKA